MLDSRPVNDGASIKRRRECPLCGKRFTTYEVIDTVPIAVVKRDGTHEFFDKHKLMLGIERACQKRPVDAEAVAATGKKIVLYRASEKKPVIELPKA